jgi:hypothetical protein
MMSSLGNVEAIPEVMSYWYRRRILHAYDLMIYSLNNQDTNVRSKVIPNHLKYLHLPHQKILIIYTLRTISQRPISDPFKH